MQNKVNPLLQRPWCELFTVVKNQDPKKAKHNATYDYYWKHGVEKDD